MSLKTFETILKLIMAGTLFIGLPVAAVIDYNKWLSRYVTMQNFNVIQEKNNAIAQNESARTLVSACLQDKNGDGTNELVVTDKSGLATILFRYGDAGAGITNRYFTIEELRNLKISQLEAEIKNYLHK